MTDTITPSEAEQVRRAVASHATCSLEDLRAAAVLSDVALVLYALRLRRMARQNEAKTPLTNAQA